MEDEARNEAAAPAVALRSPLPEPKRQRISTEEAARAREALSPAAKAEAAESLARLGIDRRPIPEAEIPQEVPGTLIESFMEFTPTSLVEKVWGRKELAEWQEKNKTETKDSKDKRAAAAAAKQPQPDPKFSYPSARDLLELVGAQDQCKAIIEPMGFNPCYICGFPLGPLQVKNGLSGECEHILSVAQAILFYDLFQRGDLDKRPPTLPKNAPDRDPVKQREFFGKEYKWSHEICNRVKSDKNIISYTEGVGFELNKVKLTELLDAIYNSKRGENLKKLIGLDPVSLERWKTSRLAPGGVNLYVAPLVDYLNKQRRIGGGSMFALVAASNILERVHEDFKKIDPVAAAAKFKIRVEAGDEIGDNAPVGIPAQKAIRKRGGKRHKTYRMRRCRLPKLL